MQGVAYRGWAQGVARRLGLRGWVRNLADGSVAALLVGPEEAVERDDPGDAAGAAGRRGGGSEL